MLTAQISRPINNITAFCEPNQAFLMLKLLATIVDVSLIFFLDLNCFNKNKPDLLQSMISYDEIPIAHALVSL